MSRRNAFVDQQRRLLDDFLGRVEEASKRAEVTDEAGQWGVDGWIRVVHDLIDAQLRTLASVVEATIGGPWWRGPRQPSDHDGVRAAETTTYDRRFEVVEPFQRIGCPGECIPHGLMRFHPTTLPAGEVEFRIDVPPAYWGANYAGKLRLCQIGEPGSAPVVHPLDVIVGL